MGNEGSRWAVRIRECSDGSIDMNVLSLYAHNPEVELEQSGQCAATPLLPVEVFSVVFMLIEGEGTFTSDPPVKIGSDSFCRTDGKPQLSQAMLSAMGMPM